MTLLHIIGIDPGIVHTGIIRLVLDEETITTEHIVVQGLDAASAENWIDELPLKVDRTFIEKYQPRMHYSTDERMVKAEAAFLERLKKKRTLLINNTGVKTLVPLQVLSVLGLDSFTTRTHHQDLLSAARIAVLGMMKSPELNKVLADAVRDSLDGNPWPIVDLGGGVADAALTD